jgi:hypothetical protein
MIRQLLLLFLVCLSATSADWSIALTEVDPYVRSNVIWRMRIIGAIASEKFTDGPYVAQLSLKQGNQVLFTQDYPLEKLGQLISGIRVAIAVPVGPQPSEIIQVHVNVSDPLRRDQRFAQTTVRTPLSLQRELEAAHQLFLQQFPSPEQQPPLPSLWFEQAGELLSGPASQKTCDTLAELLRSLTAHAAGQPMNNVTTLALRDPRDRSVQPYRLHMPADQAKISALAVVMRSPENSSVQTISKTISKSQWPTLPPEWINAALEENIALLEIYPAGDLAWENLARLRTRDVISQVRQLNPALHHAPIILCGVGRGAQGALGLMEDDPAFSAGLALHNPQLAEAALFTAADALVSYSIVGMRPAHVSGTMIIVSGIYAGETPWWLERLRRSSSNSELSVENSADNPSRVTYWQAVKKLRRVKPPRQYMVTKPGIYGPLTVSEMAQWGSIGTITTHDDKIFHCTGISRVLTPPDHITVTGCEIITPSSNKALKKIYPNAVGPISSYADAPFVVVIGTDESVAAQQDNRAFAQAFAQAWAQFAHGRPLIIDDRQFLAEKDEKKYAQHHIICMGNTRSHSLLKKWFADDKQFAQQFPLQWDARSVRLGTQTFLRAEKRPVVIAWPQPHNPTRLLIVCDGRPTWLDNGLPFVQLGDFAIGGPQANDPPTVWRTFSTTWQ